MRDMSLERELSINAMIAFTHAPDGKPLPFEILIQRLNGLSKTVHMEGFALRLTRVLDELLDLQKENADLRGLLVEGLPLALTDRSVSLRRDGLIDGPDSWLELVDLPDPVAGRYAVFENDRIDTAVQHIREAEQAHSLAEAYPPLTAAIKELTEER